MNFDLKWSPSEKKVARAAFDAALEVALGKKLAEFKRRPAMRRPFPICGRSKII
jgi:hypothetical protein